jgi:hypothetical protein
MAATRFAIRSILPPISVTVLHQQAQQKNSNTRVSESETCSWQFKGRGVHQQPEFFLGKGISR